MTGGRFAWLLILIGAAAVAQDYGPDTCVQGYVWREAFPGDHVCVDPATRAQAAEDNRLAAQRREPAGGEYGPDTCRAGFVWREARPDDHVCVPLETRAQAGADNRAARRRIVRPPAAAPGSPVKRGFDENGDPYVQVTLPDGSIRREQRKGITVIKPDGTSQFYPVRYILSNAQPPTPPELPSDPTQGRAWVSLHNEELKRLIGGLVGNDESEMRAFSTKEAEVAGTDLFRQIDYRTRVIEQLVGP